MTGAKNSFEELQQIDTLLFQKQWNKALEAFVVMLNNLATVYAGKEQTRDFHHGGDLDESAEICQRASLQWQLLLQSELDFTQLNLSAVLGNLHVLHTLLMGTRKGNLDDFIVAYHLHRNGQYNLDGLLRQLLAWCPNSRAGFTPFAHSQHAPDLVLAQAVACLADLALVGAKADDARRQAIDFLLSGKVKPEQLSRYQGINLVAQAWMRCSYADDARKHQIKPFLSQALERMVGLPKTFLLPAAPGCVDGKPVLFIPLEGMTRSHAMYRCYAEMIRACQAHFYTVGLGMDHKSDESVAALFDHFELIENSADMASLGKAFEQVQKIISRFAPAMVWFPSIGMDRWVVLLANRRMAPLQVMTLGHPATSMSREVDVALINAPLIGEHNCFSEVRVAFPADVERFQLPEDAVRITPLRDLPQDGVVRIVVPSVAQKLTAAFVRCLREVQEQATRPVEFVFFSGEMGVNHVAVTLNLQKELKRVSVHAGLSYADYIHQLNRCQLHACTFPFGGTNSLLDSLRQGLPLVTLEGDEAHARVDASFIRKAGLPDSLICHSEQAFVAELLRLVQQPDELLRLHHYLLDEVDVDQRFMQAGKPETFAAILESLYRQGREQVQAEAGMAREVVAVSVT